MSKTDTETVARDGAGSDPRAPSGFHPGLIDRLVRAEGRHFWFRARASILETVLREVRRAQPLGAIAVEVGCGTGLLLQTLERIYGREYVIGTDLFEDGIAVARGRTQCSLVRADAISLPFSGVVEVACLFDVLEHIPDEQATLRAIHESLTPNGCLVLTVPALPSLWSYADELAGHQRRYTRRTLEAALLTAGFRVEYVSYLFAASLPLFWLLRRLRPARGEAEQVERTVDELRIIPGLNEVFLALLRLEKPIIARRGLIPLGSSLLAIARL